MSDIVIHINGKEIKAKKGSTILEAAQSAGIFIPTLCHHEKLESYGGCRICTVELVSETNTKPVISCVYPVEENLNIRTRSEKIDRIRKVLLELLLAHAPESTQLRSLAEEYDADKRRFEKEASFCIHCGLCIRYCDEVIKKNAIGFINRGAKKEISFIPEIASTECPTCKECFPLCPTSYLQAEYVLIEALSFSGISERLK